MKSVLLAALSAICVAGCASPFTDHWNVGEEGNASRSDLPNWVTDEWRGEGARVDGRTVATTADAAQSQSLHELIDWALAHNPAVQAAEARWHAARNRIVQARTLPEPQLSYRIITEQIESAREPVGHAIGLVQQLPWFGTLDLAADIEQATARSAAQRYVHQQLITVADIKQAWAEYAYLWEATGILRSQTDLLDQLEALVRTQYRTAQVSQRDLIRIQAERDRVETDLRDTEDMMIAAGARLNAAVGRRADAPLPEQPTLPDGALEIDEAQLLDAILLSNPLLESLRQDVEARGHAIRLAAKRYYPTLTIGVEYGINTSQRMASMGGGGEDMLAGRIGLSLPIWRDSYDAGVQEAMATWGASLRELHEKHNQIESDLKLTLYAIRDAQRRIDLFGTRLRVRAEQVLGATETAYRAGDASFTDLLESQRELLEFLLASRRAAADHFLQIAMLERLVGRSIEPGSQSADPKEALR